MKKLIFSKFIPLVLLPLSALFLTGCRGSLWDLFGNGNATQLLQASKDGSSYDAPTKTADTSGENYASKATAFNQLDVQEAGAGYVFPSTGKVNLLVIPVIIDDFSKRATAQVREDIYHGFFGDSSETSWESLSSFYYKSSYQSLLINGVVSQWYDSGYTSAELSALTGSGEYSSYYEPTWTILEDAVSWYQKTYSTDASEFDNDNDGVIDGVWLVYSAPDSSNDTSLNETDFWAYTYSDYNAVSNTKASSKRVPFRYSWASYDFLYENYGSTGIDAHTYIHETGHMMGLDDYYVASVAKGVTANYGPMGKIDMMDYNIIDHDAYSKFALGWIDPFVVTGSTTLSLKPSQSSGQAILLPTSKSGWNGSAFDEYMLLEYYTPTGLNEKDSQSAYANGAIGFSENGVRIYHVDSRLVKKTSTSFVYTDTIVEGSTLMAHSNSSGYNYVNTSYRLVQEMDCTLKRNFDTGYVRKVVNGKTVNSAYSADNSTLFQAGDSFSFASYSSSFPRSGSMNDGNVFPFTVSFSDMSANSITVSITAN